MSGHGFYCSVDDCVVNIKDQVPFFRCPKDPIRCQQWKDSVGFVGEHKYAKISPEKAYKVVRICANHFEDNCFTASGKRLLNTAVPSKRPIKFDESGSIPISSTSTSTADFHISQNDLESVTVKEEDPLTSEEIVSVKQECELYCRLCLCVSTDSDTYIHIFPSHGENSSRQDKIQKMIQKIIPDLDLSLTHNPGICADCEVRLDAAFEFVSFSIHNQKTLIDYKSNNALNVPINIQDVVITFDDTSNKRPMTDESEVVPLKKQKPNVSCHDQSEINKVEYVIQHEDVTIKEEIREDDEYSYNILDSSEGSSSQAVIQQGCDISDSRSFEEDTYYLKHIQGDIYNLELTSTNDSEKSEVNKSGKAQECTKKVPNILKKVRVKDIKMKVKQSYESDSSKS